MPTPSSLTKAADLRADPPVVIANRVKEAVRRLKWKEADSVLPGLLPTAVDSGRHESSVLSRLTGSTGSTVGRQQGSTAKVDRGSTEVDRWVDRVDRVDRVDSQGSTFSTGAVLASRPTPKASRRPS